MLFILYQSEVFRGISCTGNPQSAFAMYAINMQFSISPTYSAAGLPIYMVVISRRYKSARDKWRLDGRMSGDLTEIYDE